MSQLIYGMDNAVLAIISTFALLLVYFVLFAFKKSREVPREPIPAGQQPPHPRRIGGEHCPICMENIANEVQANCGHVYCAECITTLWTTRHFAQLECPYCRRMVSIFFENYPVGSRPPVEVDEMVRRYNRLFSGRPRSFMERVRDFPTVLRQLLSHLFQMNTIFIIRALLMIIGLIAYVLSPFDLIPEAVFGVLGLLDDLIIVIIVLFILANAFYAAYARRQAEANINQNQQQVPPAQ